MAARSHFNPPVACGTGVAESAAGGAEGFEPRCSWRRLVSAATARLSFESRLGLEAFAIPERQRDAVAEGIEKVVLAVTASVANTKALDLVEQVVS
jgi:hypothetical protein